MHRNFALLLLATVAGQAYCQTETEFRANCRRLCAESTKAFKSKNAAWFENNSTADFVYIDGAGRIQNKRQSIDGLKQMFAQAKTLDVKVKCGKSVWSKTHGTHRNTMTTTVSTVGPDQKPRILVVLVESVDTYKRVAGKWKVSQVKEVKPAKYVMDGKPFDPSRGG